MAHTPLIINDQETISSIIGNLKRAFSRSPTVVNFLRKHRREEQWHKKDGTIAKRPRVFYKCFHCKKEFNSTQVQVDHIDPVVPPNIPAKYMSYDVLIDRIFCNESNLQILCKEHHKQKSQLENNLRREWLIKTKYIIYETVNRKNGKRYIGLHKTIDFDDGYIGSGSAFKAAVEKYGRESFFRIVLFVYDSLEDAIAKEKELVDQDVVDSDNYYNLKIGGLNYIGTGTHKGLSIICLNDKKEFASVKEAAENYKLDYKTLRNAFCLKDEDGKCSLKGMFFIAKRDFDSDKKYTTTVEKIICLDNNKEFSSGLEAALFIKSKKPEFAAIAINKAARTNTKMYGYRWARITKEYIIN